MEEHQIRQLFARLFQELNQIKGMVMALHPQVQALLDAIKAQGDAIIGALTELTTAETSAATLTQQVADLNAKLASGQQIDAEDLAALSSVTDTVNGSITTIKAAMPAPVAPATVQAATDAASASAAPAQ